MDTSGPTPLLDRMVNAVEKVRDRLVRTARVLETAGLMYAVVGGNAVATWVATIDEAAVRNTQDVDVLLSRADLERAIVAMESAGFVYRVVSGVQVSGVHSFLDGPNAKARDAVHIVFSSEKVRPEHDVPAPDTAAFESPGGFRVVPLESLVRMKLTSYRDKDKTHLRDMLGVGLIDASWTQRFNPEHARRLQMLIDSPEG